MMLEWWFLDLFFFVVYFGGGKASTESARGICNAISRAFWCATITHTSGTLYDTRLHPVSSLSYSAVPFEVCIVSSLTPLHLLMSDIQSSTSALALHAIMTWEPAKEITNSFLSSTFTTDVTASRWIDICGAAVSSSFRYNSSLPGLEAEPLYKTIQRSFFLESVIPTCAWCMEAYITEWRHPNLAYITEWRHPSLCMVHGGIHHWMTSSQPGIHHWMTSSWCMEAYITEWRHPNVAYITEWRHPSLCMVIRVSISL